MVREALPDTAARAGAERLRGAPTVVVEGGRRWRRGGGGG